MKKIFALLLSVMMVFSLTSCGEAKPTASEAPNADAPKALRIALLLPFVGDQSYMDVTYNGLKLVKEKYGDKVDTKLIEMGKDEAGHEPAFLQAAADGYDVIISGNWQYEGPMLKVAKQYPNIKFINFDYADPAANNLPNVYGITYATEEIGYLAGIVAGTKTKTNIVGGIGGMEVGGIKQFLGGYLQGVLAANPDAKVITGFVGDFMDTAKAKEIALNMNKEGADVIYHAAGGAGNGLFEAAAEKGFWAIGVDTDQFVSLGKQEKLANTVLTSALKRCDSGILNAITMVMDGTCPFGTLEVLDYSKDGVGLAENDYYKANMTADELAKVSKLADAVLKHEVKVINVTVEEAEWANLLAKTAKK